MAKKNKNRRPRSISKDRKVSKSISKSSKSKSSGSGFGLGSAFKLGFLSKILSFGPFSKKKEGENINKPKNDFVGWINDMPKYLIFSIIWLIVGSNVLYFQKYLEKPDNQKEYGEIFPDDINKAPYRDKSNIEKLKELGKKKAQEALQNIHSKRQELKSRIEKISKLKKPQTGGGKLKDALNKLLETQEKIEKNKVQELVEFKYSNPYKILRSSDKWVVGKMGKISADGIAYSFMYARSAIKNTLKYTHALGERIKFLGPEFFSFFLLPLVMIMLIMYHIIPTYGFLSTILFSVMKSFSYGITGIILAFIPYYLISAFGVSIVQPLIYAATFLFLPFIMDYKKSGEIFVNNFLKGIFVFLGLIVYSSFYYLETVISVILSITFVIAFILKMRRKNESVS